MRPAFNAGAPGALSRGLFPAGFAARGRRPLDANAILDVLHAPAAVRDVLGAMLHVALRHGARQDHPPLFDLDVEVARVHRAVLRQLLADVLADAFVGTRVVARAHDPETAAGQRKSPPGGAAAPPHLTLGPARVLV